MKKGLGLTGAAAMLAAAVMIGACASAGGGVEAANAPTYRLIINNRSDFEVVVYALQSADSHGYRLGTARSLDSTLLMIPRNVLSSTQDLVVRLHPIGQAPGIYDWVSQRISLDADLDAHLDIHADPHGDMTLSMLWVRSRLDGLASAAHH